MSVRGSLIVLSFLTLVTPGAAMGTMAYLKAQAAESETNTRLQYYTVQQGSVNLVVSAVGTIEAEQTVNLTFTTAGRVSQVYVQPGDYVLSGDPLVQLESD